LARQRPGAYAAVYEDVEIHKPNTLAGGRVPERTALIDTHRATIQRLIDDGVIQ
jgi:hypothetical protein